ncbi:hypothetical protein ACFZDJ_11680 [Streptomyces sp. NPDC007896]|uniref:hypothetical protein n=1 Tax=Streptomyces sp. NPDC007896 TaxID=3364784 RepID=UPI0036EE82B3
MLPARDGRGALAHAEETDTAARHRGFDRTAIDDGDPQPVAVVGEPHLGHAGARVLGDVGERLPQGATRREVCRGTQRPGISFADDRERDSGLSGRVDQIGKSGNSGSGSPSVVLVTRAAQQTGGGLEFTQCHGDGYGEAGGDVIGLVELQAQQPRNGTGPEVGQDEVVSDHDPVLRAVTTEEFVAASPSMQKLLEGLKRCLPDLPAEVQTERTTMTRRLVTQMAAERERALAGNGSASRASWRETAHSLIDAVAALRQAPVTRSARSLLTPVARLGQSGRIGANRGCCRDLQQASPALAGRCCSSAT